MIMNMSNRIVNENGKSNMKFEVADIPEESLLIPSYIQRIK